MKHLASLLLALVFATASPAAEQSLVLTDLAGKPHTPLVAGDRKAIVLVFVSPFCPTSNAFTPEINRIAADYADRFAFYLIEADPDIPLADAKKHVEMLEIKAPVLLDPQQVLAKQTKATITPEAVILAPEGTMLYQGRINDLYVNRTKKLKEPKTHDLRAALDAIADGQTVAVPRTQAIGCSISGMKSPSE